jgi:hypothetical protein
VSAARRSLVVAPLLLLAAEGRAEPGCPAELVLLARPAGVELARVALDETGSFALSFRHSVTLRPVVERYRIEDGKIVQIEHLFDSHGPGLPDVTGPDLVFLREGDRFRVRLRRPIERLVLRPSRASENRLEAAATLDLAELLTAGPLELVPVPCAERR